MGTLAFQTDERVADVLVDPGFVIVALQDGRRTPMSLEWYPRLARPTPAHRANREPCAGGYGIH